LLHNNTNPQKVLTRLKEPPKVRGKEWQYKKE